MDSNLDSQRFSEMSGRLSKCAQKLTCEGSQQETVYGEITDCSFLKILQVWKSWNCSQSIRFLDIGCGSGFTLYLARAFFDRSLALSCGIDISTHRIEMFAYDIYCKLFELNEDNCKFTFFIIRDITKFHSLVSNVFPVSWIPYLINYISLCRNHFLIYFSSVLVMIKFNYHLQFK